MGRRKIFVNRQDELDVPSCLSFKGIVILGDKNNWIKLTEVKGGMSFREKYRRSERCLAEGAPIFMVDGLYTGRFLRYVEKSPCLNSQSSYLADALQF